MNGFDLRIVGPGRAGRSFALAASAAGARVDLLDRAADAGAAASGVDLLLLCVPDDRIADVAASVAIGDAVVGHCSGSRTLDVLTPHVRRCSVHPLMSLPDDRIGSARLLDRCHFAVAGDAVADRLVDVLGGVAFTVADADRASYHAIASIAANHLVALCAQVERLAGSLDVPVEAFWRMMDATLANVAARGARAALTGPAARGDWDTVAAHLGAIGAVDRALYVPLARAAAALADRDWPAGLG